MSGFEGFADTPEAPFYRSGASSPERTWAEAAQRLSRVLNHATADAERGLSQMTVERICGWHRAIFLTTFELDAGRIRSDLEPIAFSVPIEIDGEMRDVPMEGTRGQSLIVEELRAACENSTRNSHLYKTVSTPSRRRKVRLRRPSFTARSLHRAGCCAYSRRAANPRVPLGAPPPRRVLGLGDARRRAPHRRSAYATDRRVGGQG